MKNKRENREIREREREFMKEEMIFLNLDNDGQLATKDYKYVQFSRAIKQTMMTKN